MPIHPCTFTLARFTNVKGWSFTNMKEWSFTNRKEWSFTPALGGREQTLTKEQGSSWERCQDEGLFLGKGNRCFGKPDNCAGRRRGWWCTGVWRQAPCWQGRAPSAQPAQPSIMLRPQEHRQRSATRQRRHMMQWAQVCSRHRGKAAGLCIHNSPFPLKFSRRFASIN